MRVCICPWVSGCSVHWWPGKVFCSLLTFPVLHLWQLDNSALQLHSVASCQVVQTLVLPQCMTFKVLRPRFLS